MYQSQSVLFSKTSLHQIPKQRQRHRSRSLKVQAIVETGIASVQGTSRKQNEDRFALDIEAKTSPVSYAAVFDGHGGYACSDWLSTNFINYVSKFWDPSSSPKASISNAFTAADRKILAPKGGFLGMVGERGIGGSKCGSTAAVALFFKDKTSGKPLILSANAGDARILLGRAGKPVQLSEDHVPDSEDERNRIEAQNPNPNMPLVRYIGGTWRVGGLLALSRAFGDAYLKGTGQFEGVQAGSDGYSSGFGVIADPHIVIEEITADDTWVIVSSDGLFANEERGGGGGLSNEEVIKMCDKLTKKSCSEIALSLVDAAQDAGTTDDVTVAVIRLK